MNKTPTWFCLRIGIIYYKSREVPKEDLAERDKQLTAINACKNQMEIITAKQHIGPIGSDMIGRDISTNRFWNLEHQREAEFRLESSLKPVRARIACAPVRTETVASEERDTVIRWNGASGAIYLHILNLTGYMILATFQQLWRAGDG